MTTLVTGAGGFIGGHVVRRLLEAGEAVRALDIAWASEPPPEAERITASILDPDALKVAMRGAEAVIHAAAIAHLWTPKPRDYDRVNSFGTCRVLAAARREGARMVLVSSYVTLVARDQSGTPTLDETTSIAPAQLLGPYPRTKRQAELFALSAAALGQPVTIVMPSAPVGAGDASLTPPTRMLRDLARGRVPALLDTSLNLVDVRAVAEAIISARDRGQPGERYLLTGEDLNMRDIADSIAELSGHAAPRRSVPIRVALAAAHAEAMLARLTKRPPTAPLTGIRLAARPCHFDNSKARAELGFAPRAFRACLPETIDWLREAGHLDPSS